MIFLDSKLELLGYYAHPGMSRKNKLFHDFSALQAPGLLDRKRVLASRAKVVSGKGAKSPIDFILLDIFSGFI